MTTPMTLEEGQPRADAPHRLMTMIRYNGQIVAFASRLRLHLVQRRRY